MRLEDLSPEDRKRYDEAVRTSVEAYVEAVRGVRKERQCEEVHFATGWRCVLPHGHQASHRTATGRDWSTESLRDERIKAAEAHDMGTLVYDDAILTVPGRKDDQGKPLWNLLPWGAVSDVVDVLTMGAKKYTPDGWKHVPDARNRYFAAAMRHLTAWWSGENLDPESGKSHLAHATCCILFLATFDKENK